MTYVSRMAGIEIDRQSTEFMCWTASAEQVLNEAKVFGFRGSVEHDLVTLQRP